jgi:hypothetical protein
MIIAGVIVDSGQLAPSSDSKMIRIADGKTDITEGPVVDRPSERLLSHRLRKSG